jgi:hypothetical protein
MKLDPGIHIVKHLVFFGKSGVTAPDRSDRCEPLVGFASGELLDSCIFRPWCWWFVLSLFGVVLLGFV